MSTTPNTPVPSIAAQVNAAQASGLRIPASLKLLNSNDLGDQFFHGLIYGETDARKTVTAAQFGGPEKTLLLLTRNIEQAKPLEGQGYRIAHAMDAESLNFALSRPELLYPDWAKIPDRVFDLDDLSAAVKIISDDAEGRVGTAFGANVKEAGQVIGAHLNSLRRKPMHLVMTALAKVSTNKITQEEQISIDLPPSILSMIGTDIEFGFYIDRAKWKFLTTTDTMTYTAYDQDQKKDVTMIRRIFAKNKLPMSLVGKNPAVLAKHETMDLKAIWGKIQCARSTK